MPTVVHIASNISSSLSRTVSYDLSHVTFHNVSRRFVYGVYVTVESVVGNSTEYHLLGM